MINCKIIFFIFIIFRPNSTIFGYGPAKMRREKRFKTINSFIEMLEQRHFDKFTKEEIELMREV